MRRAALALLALGLAWPVLAAEREPDRRRGEAGAESLEERCRREVERRHPPGTLSRNRGERGQLIQACIAQGGRMPGG